MDEALDVDHPTGPPATAVRRIAAGSLDRAGQPHPRRRLDAELDETRIGEDLVGRPVADDRPAVDDDDPRSTGRRGGPSCARRSAATFPVRPAGGAPPRPSACRPDRAGRSARRGSRGGVASRGATRSPTSCAWPPDSLGGWRSTMRLEVRAGRSPLESARRHPARRGRGSSGPRAISSKTVAAIPERWVLGFWKPITTRSASSWVLRPAIGSPSIASVPVSLPPIDAGASPDATRHSVDLPASFGPTRPTISPSPMARSTPTRTSFA